MIWKFANIRGIPLQLHISMIVLLPMIAIGLGGNHLLGLVESLGRSPTELAYPTIASGICIAFGLFLSIIGHELGHALVAQKCGARVKSITIMLLGGITQIEEKSDLSAQEAFKIAVAGPLMNVILGIVCFVIARSADQFLDLLLVFAILGSANLFIAAFNLIPAFPLDGGRILEALLWGIMGEPRGRRTAASVSRFIALFLGLLAMLNGSILLLILSIFLFLGSISQRAIAEQKAKSPKSLNLGNSQLLPVVQIAESMAPEQAVSELRKNDCLLALVRSVKGKLLGLIDLQTLETMNLPSLTGVPLHRFKSVHLGETASLIAQSGSDWFLVYDEYNVLLGAARVEI